MNSPHLQRQSLGLELLEELLEGLAFLLVMMLAVLGGANVLNMLVRTSV
jgi:hypothetical protein